MTNEVLDFPKCYTKLYGEEYWSGITLTITHTREKYTADDLILRSRRDADACKVHAKVFGNRWC